MSRKKIIIGISGVAQSGKDTFYQLSSKYLYEELGLSCKRYALADSLKDECKDFLKEKFNLNVYSQNIKDKNIFRPFLVWFGDIKRQQTQGKYFTSILEKQITKDDVDVALITDIRYGEYPEDESFWLKEKLGGFLIHVTRYDNDGNVVNPANDNERRNNPIMKKEADFRLEWDSEFDPNDRLFEVRMYNWWKSTLEDIYLNKVRIKKDVAVMSAMEIAKTLMKE